jgi:hypothetical protein
MNLNSFSFFQFQFKLQLASKIHINLNICQKNHEIYSVRLLFSILSIKNMNTHIRRKKC